MLDHDERVFWGSEFSVSVTLRKADGSAEVRTRGIPENALMEEHLTGRASHRSFHPQITVPTRDAGCFGEGDLAAFLGKTHVILDDFFDGTQTTFTLEERDMLEFPNCGPATPSQPEQNVGRDVVHGVAHGEAVLNIPVCLYYSVRVIDTDASSSPDLLASHQYVTDGGDGDVLPEGGGLNVPQRLDGRNHPAKSYAIPAGVSVYYEFLPA